MIAELPRKREFLSLDFVLDDCSTSFSDEPEKEEEAERNTEESTDSKQYVCRQSSRGGQNDCRAGSKDVGHVWGEVLPYGMTGLPLKSYTSQFTKYTHDYPHNDACDDRIIGYFHDNCGAFHTIE